MSVSLVAGLGNPGRAYADTRHNLGWLVVEALAARLGLTWQTHGSFDAEVARWEKTPGSSWFFVKPLRFMNDSGPPLRSLASYYKVPTASVIVVYDDLTLPLGGIKVSVRGSAGGHNGVASVLQHLGDGFIRYRCGIGPKTPREIDLKDFVLGKFSTNDQHHLQSKLSALVDGLALLIDRGASQAMNALNRRPNEPEQA